MIETDGQYQMMRQRMAEFEDALAHAEDLMADRDPLLQSILRKNIEDELQTMYEHMVEFEARRDGRAPLSALSEGVDLSTALIRARIAAGLRQADLAERVGIPAEQVCKFEMNRYSDVELQRLEMIASVLGLSIAAEPSVGEYDGGKLERVTVS